MRSPIFIFGHKNPDTDSICSAIAYAELKRKLGIENTLACRLGEINKETRFVLDYFNVEEPMLLTDIKVKLRDLELYSPVLLNKNDPIKKAWDVLKENRGSRLLPVVSETGMLEGILAIGDILKLFMDTTDEEFITTYDILFDNILNILDGKIVAGTYNYECFCGALHLGTASAANGPLTDKDILITDKVENARRYANSKNSGCVILTNDFSPIDVEKAKCAVVCVKHSKLSTVTLIKQAVSVGSVMNKKDFETFSTENHVDDIYEMMKSSTHRNFPVVERDGRLFGVISRRHIMEYDRKQVILVDHNEKRQSVDGLEQASILEVIDHHRIADIQTDYPLYIHAAPVGSTATIVYKLYVENDVEIDTEDAGLLLSAILSDTLMFRSPTCTPSDRAAAEKLAVIAGVNISEYGEQMFSVGTSLVDFTPEQILANDRKQFSFDKYQVSISQVYTLDFATIVSKKDELFAAMVEYSTNHNNDLVMLLITDILADGSELLVAGKAKDLTSKAFNIKLEETSIFLPGVVSRKKQVVPKLTAASRMI